MLWRNCSNLVDVIDANPPATVTNIALIAENGRFSTNKVVLTKICILMHIHIISPLPKTDLFEKTSGNSIKTAVAPLLQDESACSLSVTSPLKEVKNPVGGTNKQLFHSA